MIGYVVRAEDVPAGLCTCSQQSFHRRGRPKHLAFRPQKGDKK
jgi:hypothetical protein